MKQLITIYSPPCVYSWVWGTYWCTEEDIWYLRVVFIRAFNIPTSQNGWVLDFCAKTSGLIMWLVYPIIESFSLCIYRCVPPTHKYGTRPFLRWARSQGRNPHASGKAKNTFGIKSFSLNHSIHRNYHFINPTTISHLASSIMGWI